MTERCHIDDGLWCYEDVRFCKGCLDETKHVVFDMNEAEWRAICASCLTRWTPVKPSQLFVCEHCRARILRREEDEGYVTRDVPDCFEPDPSTVSVFEFICSRCIPPDVAEVV